VRAVRGVFASGESTIAKLYLLEGKQEKEARRASYLYPFSTLLGIVLASAMATLAISIAPSFPTIWRYCFVLAGASALFALSLRRRSFAKEETQQRSSYFDVYCLSSLHLLWRERRSLVQASAVLGFSYATYVVPFVLLNNYVPLVTSHSLEAMMQLNTFLLLCDMALIPFLGKVTARWRPLAVMKVSCAVLALSALPLFYLLQGASLLTVTFVRLWFVFWGVAFMCPQNYWLKKRFGGPSQYLLTGMAGALGGSTVGRMTTPVCLFLWHTYAAPWQPALYIALISFLAYLALGRRPAYQPEAASIPF
jgi:MFS family permease